MLTLCRAGLRKRIFTLTVSAAFPFLLNAAFITAQTPQPGFQDRQAGIRFYNEGKTAEAIAALRSAVKQDKLDGNAWYYLGLALVRIDDMKGARKALGEAVKLKPQFAPA